MIKTSLMAIYALVAYGIGLLSLVALMSFLFNLTHFLGVDVGAPSDLLSAVIVNIGLLIGYFCLHSVMARPGFKRRWTRMVSPALERSTYILVSGLTLLALMALWQPIPGKIWQSEVAWLTLALYGVNALGWTIMVLATFNIDHFDFFGLKQVWHAIRRRDPDQTPFSARYLYGLVRHPISLGWMLVFWATPDMTVGHLLMATVATVYILAITPVEEADLIKEIGQPYVDYRQRVRAFVPLPKKEEPVGTGNPINSTPCKRSSDSS